MAAYNKFNQFVEDIAKKVHDVSADSLRVLLVTATTTPVAADIKVDTTTGTCTVGATSSAAEIVAGNGYTKKGTAATITTSSQSGGTFTLAANQVVYTAAGGTLPASGTGLRYVLLYNDTALTTATRPVIAWWDYGATLILNDAETFTVKFNNATPGTIFTIT